MRSPPPLLPSVPGVLVPREGTFPSLSPLTRVMRSARAGRVRLGGDAGEVPAHVPEAGAGGCDYTPMPGTVVEEWSPDSIPDILEDFPGKPQVQALGGA